MKYLLYKYSNNKFFAIQKDFTIYLDETITRDNVDLSKYTKELNIEKIAALNVIQNSKLSIIIELETGIPDKKLLSKIEKENIFLKSKIFFYWKKFSLFERIDKYKIGLYKRLNTTYRIANFFKKITFKNQSTYKYNKTFKGLDSSKIEQFRFEKKSITFVDKSFENSFDLLNQKFSEKIKPNLLVARLDYWNSNTNMGGAFSHVTGVIRALSQHFNIFLCSVDNEVYKFELDDINIKYVDLIRPNLGNDFKDILFSDDYFLDQLEQVINENSIDIIYERMCLGNTSCAQISRKKNIAYIAEYNGSEIDIINDSGLTVPFENTFKNYEMFNFMNADIISVVSKQVKDQLLDLNIPSNKIIINPNGADPKKLSKFTEENFKSIRETLNISKNEFVIGYVGTFSTWHNIDFLMKLINFVCKKNCEIKFILIGLDYTNKNFLELIEDNKEIKSQIMIMGKLPPKVKDYFLQVSDATIITNKNKINNKEFFGSPIKLFEYMSLGKPIISTKVKNIEDYLKIYTDTIDQNLENVNGFVIDNDESTTLKLDQIFDKFYNVINFLKLNSKISNKIGENSRNHFLKNYTWEANINKLLYVIKNEYK